MNPTAYDDEAILAERIERDSFLCEHYASPIPEEIRSAYEGAEYFDPDRRFAFSGEFAPSVATVSVPSSSGLESGYRCVGNVRIAIGGQDYDLTVLDDGDGGAFLPFGDPTNGNSTYGGGRYVAVDMHDDGTATVDFNRAVNPYCAYDEEYSCPLPPAGNTIAEPIEAGERDFREPPV
jgi:uncharacterized protein (DUF1684 family)